MRRYRDRRDAGRVLAGLLSRYQQDPLAFVAALPRGGVPVGYEIARELHLPLDIFVVRKIGVPNQPELALGAVASGGLHVVNEHIAAQMGYTERELEPLVNRELAELARREAVLRVSREALSATGKTVILTDDGLATGASMRAAVETLGRAAPDKIVVAVPVGATETLEKIRGMVDEVVCPFVPADFYAVGEWYEDFRQTGDEEVVELLRASNI